MKKNILLSTFLSMLILSSPMFAADMNVKAEETNGKGTPTTAEILSKAKEFLKNLPGEFKLDNTRTEKVGDYNLATIKNGDWLLSDHPLPLVDSFTQRTSAFATIFVKSGSEFVRASTSLITENNEDAAGTILSHTNPAYESLMNGKRYTGVVELFGQKYMSDYNVFRDKNGRVIGAYLVGIPMVR